MNTHKALVPPARFLKLLAHEVRWQLLAALVRSDYRVQELVKLLRKPPNLLSYHLGRLRDHALVAEHRSTADGRDIYYSLKLDNLRTRYLESGAALHPSLAEAGTMTRQQGQSKTRQPTRVLFLCTNNSARSQMAEAVLRHLGADRVKVFSAGSEPTAVDPDAVRAMARMDVDMSQQRAKNLNEFLGQSFDYIITVCDRVREACPSFPGDPERIHWSFPDPATTPGGPARRHRAFEETALQLTTRIRYLLMAMERQQRRS